LHAFAEYTTSPWESVNPIPDDIDTRFAVASIVQGLTALTFATEAYDIKKGDWVLIHTVAGGFGLFLTQVAHARGARIIGTTSSQEKAAIAKDFGADHVIVYTEENTVDKVLEYTGGAGVNVIYDGVGKDT
jgi:NADPH2:quinone reductase